MTRDGRRGRPQVPWAPGDWPSRDDWRRRRMESLAQDGPGGPPWAGRRGFGCVFALLFLFVAGSLVAGMAIVVSQLGPVPGIVALVAVVLVLAWMGRTLFLTARTLDRLVDASRRVEAGDYSIRIDTRHRSTGGLRVVDQLTQAFDTMTERLEADEQQRRTLLADISHELRTPLSVVQGNIEAVIDGVYPADASHLAIVLEETHVLGRLIDDLRTLALSEAGTLTLHREPTDPEILIGEIVRSFEPAATSAQVDLGAVIEGDLPILEIDPVRIREVLANLIANAIRHTPPAGRVAVTGRLEAAGRVRFDVSDTGSGITPEFLPRVFDRFVKGDSSVGSGLGLAIARQLVIAHDGEISVASESGSGTTFSVWLPTTVA
jgi:signal transduction histidine kinase